MRNLTMMAAYPMKYTEQPTTQTLRQQIHDEAKRVARNITRGAEDAGRFKALADRLQQADEASRRSAE